MFFVVYKGFLLLISVGGFSPLGCPFGSLHELSSLAGLSCRKRCLSRGIG
ncbi:hypothetical protein KC19_4G063500 [Ceratodon purpureus]|uniref:Uncharacterized protein n=1 Tax=Ceratodon purpureus TaxID=3225 RepID=A0A8T0I7N8_CERPU|nr:hypothetical protein KC19_4G063500 [Ceratodon purpureus]